MTREIKFRAWDKEISKMSIKSFVLGESSPLEYGDMICERNVEIMQFTGLFDKNNVEIYEGDIVRYGIPKKNYIPMKGKGEKSLVRFDSGGFVCGEGWLSDILIFHDIEVIGNIYENSDLLK